MRHLRACLTFAFLTAGLMVPGSARAAADATYIVQLRAGYTLAQGRASVAAAGGAVTGPLPIIRGLAADLSPAARARLARDPSVAAIDVNAPTSSQSSDRGDAPLGASYASSVFAPQAWRRATGAGVGVAVIDTGID